MFKHFDCPLYYIISFLWVLFLFLLLFFLNKPFRLGLLVPVADASSDTLACSSPTKAACSLHCNYAERTLIFWGEGA